MSVKLRCNNMLFSSHTTVSRNKWLKRVTAFFRLTAEKSLLRSVSWEPGNLHFVDAATSLHNLLVESDMLAISLSPSVAQESIFSDIERELSTALQNAARAISVSSTTSSNQQTNPASLRQMLKGNFYSNPRSSLVTGIKDKRDAIDNSTYCNNAGGSNSSGVVSPGTSYFQIRGCNQRMVREYFTILGRVVAMHPEIAQSGRLQKYLCEMCRFPHLDYLSRLVVTSLVFTDEGYLSAPVLKSWTTSQECSSRLRNYLLCLFRTLLSSRPEGVLKWGLEICLSQVRNPSDRIPDSNLFCTYSIVLISRRSFVAKCRTLAYLILC